MKTTCFPVLILLAAFIPLAAAAQSTLTLTPSATVVYPGEPLSIAVTLGGGALPSGIQWSAPLPGLVTAAGAATTAAGKTVQCATVASATNCVVSGLNKTKLGDGVVATITVPTATPGPLQLGLTGLLGATDTALPITITSAAVNVVVTTKCDIDKSGSVDANDVSGYLPQVLGSAPCNQSLTGDGKCDIRSLIVLIYAALPGGACAAR